jgi:hypothetical protein
MPQHQCAQTVWPSMRTWPDRSLPARGLARPGGPQRRMKARPRYKSTPRVALRVVPLYDAEIVAEAEMRTKDVLTVKVALPAPAGMHTLEGTLAAASLLESATWAPPAVLARLR